MIIFEILVIVAICAFVANGMRVGAIEALGRLIGSIAGFLAAKYYAAWLVGILALFMPIQHAYLVSFIAIFLVVDALIGFVFTLADKVFAIITRLPLIKQIDSVVGGFLGFFESIMFIGGISWLLQQTSAVSGKLTALLGLKTITLISNIFQTLMSKFIK
jgi:uncharacterized membrane protein required for colicin V production